jgi:hypothetical protein
VRHAVTVALDPRFRPQTGDADRAVGLHQNRTRGNAAAEKRDREQQSDSKRSSHESRVTNYHCRSSSLAQLAVKPANEK